MRTNNRKGFTLIELLIVVVIIGILAAVAIPKFSNTKEKAYIANLRTDLKNLATAQESYFGDRTTYATTAQITTAPYSFTMSVPTIVPTITATAAGWSATATDPRVTTTGATNICGIFGGAGPRPTGMPATTPEGVVACWAP